MSQFTRRDFLTRVSGLVGLAPLAGLVTGCSDRPATTSRPDLSAARQNGSIPWRYAICNEIMEGWSWERQCQYAAELGYEGLEVAPFTLAGHVDEISADVRAEMRETARQAGVEVTGLHWLLVTPTGLHVTGPDEQLRRESWDYVVKLGELCRDLGGRYMIFGSPGQRSTSGMSVDQAVANFTEGLTRIAPALGEYGVTLVVEPLRRTETDVINTIGEAIAVVEAVNHPAVGTMIDFHHTVDEPLPLEEVIRTYRDHIQYIQIQEMDGTYMRTDEVVEHFTPAFRALQETNYDGWISLEVFDFDPGPETIASVSMETLRRIEQAM